MADFGDGARVDRLGGPAQLCHHDVLVAVPPGELCRDAVALIGVAIACGFLGFGLSQAPTRRALAISTLAAGLVCALAVAWTLATGELAALAPTVLALPIAFVSGITWSMTTRPPAR